MTAGETPLEDVDAFGDEPLDTASIDTGGMELVDSSRSCSDCAKRDVCAVYGNIAPQVGEEIPRRTGGEPAFDPDDIAIICEMYVEADE